MTELQKATKLLQSKKLTINFKSN